MHTKLFFWIISYAATIVFMSIAVYHLNVVHKSFMHEQNQITSVQSLDSYLNDYWQKNSISEDKIPLYIPTGIFIDTLKWVDAETFLISGYIWQKFNEKVLAISKPGFALPDGIEMEIKEAYNLSLGSEKLYGWHFNGKLNQRFDYSKFPLDEETIKIRLWHGDFNHRVLSVPDFVSYDDTEVNAVFGLSPEIKMSGYKVLDTFFKYQRLNYDTNLGIPTFSRKIFPEMTFNVELKRDIVNILITHLFPIIVVIFLCFLTLLSNTFSPQDGDQSRGDYINVLAASSAMFFVVILAHSYLRQTMALSGFVYFEYIYIITYASIVYVTIDSFLLATTNSVVTRLNGILAYHNNLIPKVLFLPLVSFSFMYLALKFY